MAFKQWKSCQPGAVDWNISSIGFLQIHSTQSTLTTILGNQLPTEAMPTLKLWAPSAVPKIHNGEMPFRRHCRLENLCKSSL
jgi:hypothetical protein